MTSTHCVVFRRHSPFTPLLSSHSDVIHHSHLLFFSSFLKIYVRRHSQSHRCCLSHSDVNSPFTPLLSFPFRRKFSIHTVAVFPFRRHSPFTPFFFLFFLLSNQTSFPITPLLSFPFRRKFSIHTVAVFPFRRHSPFTLFFLFFKSFFFFFLSIRTSFHHSHRCCLSHSDVNSPFTPLLSFPFRRHPPFTFFFFFLSIHTVAVSYSDVKSPFTPLLSLPFRREFSIHTIAFSHSDVSSPFTPLMSFPFRR